MAQNSSTKHLKLLKKIINLSVANSYMAFNPFSTYKVEREPVEVDFLDEEELRKIIKTTDRIVFYAICPFHYFLFCICYGMNASIISVGLPSSVNAPRRYLLGLHSGSQ